MRVHSRHNSNTRKTLKIVLVAVILLMLGFVVPVVFTQVSRVVLAPVHGINTWFRESTNVVPLYFRERDALIEENKALKNELAIAAGTNLTQQRLFEENNWLRQLLHTEVSERIAAAVIARPSELPYDLLQIDKGSNTGVVVGAPVYIGIDNVIGIVSSVADEYAFVELFTTPSFEATAFISGPNVVATIEGYGGGVARVRVPQGVSLAIGNVVYLPSIEPGAFGRIAYIENSPTQPEQFGYITLQKPIHSIHFVAVGATSVAPATPEAVSDSVQEIIRNSVKVSTEEVTETLNVASSTDNTEGSE